MKTPQEILHDFFKDKGRLSQVIRIIISELEERQKSLSEIEFLEFKQLDQRINEWKQLL